MEEKNEEMIQEILSLIRSDISIEDLREQLNDYHDADLAEALEELDKAVRGNVKEVQTSLRDVGKKKPLKAPDRTKNPPENEAEEAPPENADAVAESPLETAEAVAESTPKNTETTEAVEPSAPEAAESAAPTPDSAETAPQENADAPAAV